MSYEQILRDLNTARTVAQTIPIFVDAARDCGDASDQLKNIEDAARRISTLLNQVVGDLEGER